MFWHYFWNGKCDPKTSYASMRHSLELVYKKSGVKDAKNHRFPFTEQMIEIVRGVQSEPQG